MELKEAKKIYSWLWWSPAVTFPTFFILYISGIEDMVGESGLILLAALWHLILLPKAIGHESVFVRWHARQAMLLGAVRTIIPFGIASGVFNDDIFFWTIIIYFVGTLIGQGQAENGKCSLMRWAGVAEELPNLPKPLPKIIPSQPLEELVEVIRFSQDHQKRTEALAELKKLGLVEEL